MFVLCDHEYKPNCFIKVRFFQSQENWLFQKKITTSHLVPIMYKWKYMFLTKDNAKIQQESGTNNNRNQTKYLNQC